MRNRWLPRIRPTVATLCQDDGLADDMNKLNLGGVSPSDGPSSSRSALFGEAGYRPGRKRMGSPQKSQVFFG